MPLTWRVAVDDLRKGFKVKTSSPPFKSGGYQFCLDVYLEGWGDSDRDHTAVYVRFVSPRGRAAGTPTVALQGGPSWTAKEPTLFANVADGTARTRSGEKRFVPRATLDSLAYDGVVVFTASVALSATRKKAAVAEAPPAEDLPAPASMTEAEIQAALDQVEREEVLGLADPKVKMRSSDVVTQFTRNVRFGMGVVPIVLRYRAMKHKISKMRKQVKHVDPEGYYDERTTMMDDEHEKQAEEIRKLFNRMGGLYNKLAQDWATRDGLIPQAWVDELKDSFEKMPPRPWPVMEKALTDGLKGEGVAPVRPGKDGLEAYFASVDTEPLAAASIGQVHVARSYSRGRVIVKAIYPEIRRYLVADLINARRAAQHVCGVLKLPVKGTVDAIMDEQVDSFPRELDLRIEARHLRKQRLYQLRHGLEIAIPEMLDHLSSSSVLTQTFLPGVTMSSVDRSDPEVRRKAVKAVTAIAECIGCTMFRERFFHSDPHPGNIMLLGDAMEPGLIDFGQCTTLTKEQLRTVCHVVILLRTRSPTLIDQALRTGGFAFNTEDPELKMALLYYFFDSSTTGNGAVRPEAMDFLKDAIQHKPSVMPVLTDTPREMVFYGRVCGTIRKSFERLGADVSCVQLWYREARKALAAINRDAPDSVSSALLL
eukprot:CAMPEP_0119267132 /NCGR_PEP_ID=MMETSP1329-20130426/5386_1 /TAXON_ID=114041 /ORGANISM="Genus nov. species nov., Strain RCC1024" /LENGTH=651 /DNA_ID=CAMNT_0007267043 /DNA_START=106 /DNA_END=2058 /DNA_ORIENTATION=+